MVRSPVPKALARYLAAQRLCSACESESVLTGNTSQDPCQKHFRLQTKASEEESAILPISRRRHLSANNCVARNGLRRSGGGADVRCAAEDVQARRSGATRRRARAHAAPEGPRSRTENKTAGKGYAARKSCALRNRRRCCNAAWATNEFLLVVFGLFNRKPDQLPARPDLFHRHADGAVN